MNASEQKYQFAPFPYFGGKRSIASTVWSRLGRPTHYIEPFCGSAAVLLAAPLAASLEVINDVNFHIANFWRALKHQPEACYQWQDYPVSHVDLAAYHVWLTDPARVQALCQNLMDADWPGDPKIAGRWCYGQSCWIGSGWCEKTVPAPSATPGWVCSKVPHVSDAGMGVRDWFLHLASRLERVRIIHGDWDRCLNHHYGGKDTAIFFDPPYNEEAIWFSPSCLDPEPELFAMGQSE